jgi:hypothetical protein
LYPPKNSGRVNQWVRMKKKNIRFFRHLSKGIWIVYSPLWCDRKDVPASNHSSLLDVNDRSKTKNCHYPWTQ